MPVVTGAREPPQLTSEELRTLARTGRVERRERSGKRGSAFVVVETCAAPTEIWSVLVDVESWQSKMRGVKSVTVRERYTARAPTAATAVPPTMTQRATFHVTKLRLPANLVLAARGSAVSEDGAFEAVMNFGLDKSRTNLAVEQLDGSWRVERGATDKLTRVWLQADVGACALVPPSALDYVADKALRRATAWIDPHVRTLD